MTPTQVLTLAMLAVAWLAIAFPLAMRTRSQSVSGSVTGFTRAMSVLDPELKASTVSAATSSSTRRGDASSHLQVLRRLLAMAVLSTVVFWVAAWQWGGVFIPLSVVSAVGTVGYVGVLRRRKVEQDRARAVITSIRDHAGLLSRPRRQREVLPRVVGQGPDLLAEGGSALDRQRSHFAIAPSVRSSLTPSLTPSMVPSQSSGESPSTRASGFASDVRVVSEDQPIQAHHGFDVLH